MSNIIMGPITVRTSPRVVPETVIRTLRSPVSECADEPNKEATVCIFHHPLLFMFQPLLCLSHVPSPRCLCNFPALVSGQISSLCPAYCPSHNAGVLLLSVDSASVLVEGI